MWLTLLGNRWVWLIAAFGLTLLYAGCEHKRAEGWKVKYTTLEIQVKVLGEAAQKKAKETEAKQKEVTKEVKNETKRDRAVISQFYGNGLRVKPSGGCPVSTPPSRPERTNDPAAKSAPSGEGPTVQSCALDAEQVMKWQEFAIKNKFPIEH